MIIPRLGILVSGSGEATYDPSCSGTGCASFDTDNLSADYDDKSRLALELDVLAHLGPAFRIGGGLTVVPSSTFEADTDTSETKNGTEVMPQVILEGVFGGKVAGTVRGFAGLPILVPADDMDDLVETFENACDTYKAAGASCSTNSGPFLGYAFGAGGGILGQVGEGIALRGDVAVQYQSLWGPSLEASGGGTKYEVETSLSATRIWLMAGAEF